MPKMQDTVATRNIEELNSKLFEVKFDLSGTDFEAIENIGSGAYGVVCSAMNKRHPGERVAIKKIPDIFSETTIAIAMRTYREIRILKHFRHDNIISIREILRPHDAEMATFTDVYIVLDLMESDLHRIIYSQQELTDEHVRYFLYQILRGLKYIHSANVVHRDLKPSNLLINENCELKIGDFGMARGISSSPDSYNMKMTQYVATRWYRAPELMLLSLNYTAAIDIWSVGCILAEMLGRHQLFPGRNYRHQLELIFDVVGSPSHDYVNLTSSDLIRDFLCKFGKKEPVVLQSKFPGANQKAVRLISKMLKLNPSDRVSVEDALCDPYLSRYHDPDDEPICIPVFDFSFEKQRLDSAALRAVITKEIMDYHQPKSPALSMPFSLVPVPSTLLTEPDKSFLEKSCSDRPVANLSDAVCKNEPSTSEASVDSTSLKNDDSATGCFQFQNRQESFIADGENERKNRELVVKVDKADENGNIEMRSAGRSQGSVLEAEIVGNDVSMPSARVLVEGDDASAASIEQTSSTVSTALEGGAQLSTAMDAKARIKAALLNSDRRRQQTELIDSSRQQSKGVTALQRQKEREEKRRLKMERVMEKKKKSRPKDNRPKGPTLSDEDRTLLERWEKMEKMVRSVRTSVSTTNEDSCSNPPASYVSEHSRDSLVYDSPATPQTVRSSTPNVLSTVEQNWTRQASDGFSALSGFSLNRPTEARQSMQTCSSAETQPFFSQQPPVNRPDESHFNGGQFTPLMSVLAQPSQTLPNLPFTSYFTSGSSIHPGLYGFSSFQTAPGHVPGIAAQNLVNNVTFDHNHLPPYAEAIQSRSVIDENGKNFPIYEQPNRDFYRPQMTTTSTSDPGWRLMMPSGDASCRLEPTVSNLMLPPATSFRDLVESAASEQLPTATEVGRVGPLPPPDGLQVITSRLLRSHFDDLTLQHTPKGTGAGYGVGSFEMLSQSLFAGDSTTPLDGPESAPLSATLMADWRSVTGDMDANDLEAVLQAELRGLIGSPRINLNLNDLNNLT